MTALAKVETLTLKLPATAVEVAKLEAAAAELTAILPDVQVTDDDTYALADELLTQAVQLLDAAKVCRGSVTGPVYAEIKKVEARFRPGIVVPLEGFIISVKKQIGAYRIELAQAEAAARQAAQEAAASGDADALVQSLNDADTLAQRPADTGARVAVHWRIKRIIPDLLPDEWWCPNELKISGVALNHRGGVDDPPVIPGVVFEPVADVSAKH
jgi:hypothetical protein